MDLDELAGQGSAVDQVKLSNDEEMGAFLHHIAREVMSERDYQVQHDDNSIVGSVRSFKSAVVSDRARELARLAGLKSRAAYLNKKHELEKQEIELKARRENLDIEMEIDEAKAREAVLSQFEESYGEVPTPKFLDAVEENDPFGDSHQKDQHVEPPPKAGTPVHAPEPIRRLQAMAAAPQSTRLSIIDNSDELVRRLHLPTLEMSTFTGDIENYRCFMRTFETNIASKLNSEEEKLHYLLQYTAAKPKEIAATCLYLPPERGYMEAKRLLDCRYGSQAQTAASLVDKIIQHSVIKSEDVEGLDSFAIYLRGCYNALKCLPSEAVSIDVKTIRSLVDKVPYHMKEKWRRIVDNIEQSSCRQAGFRDFVEFVQKEARIASNPSYGRHLAGISATNGQNQVRNNGPGQSGNAAKSKLMAGSLKPAARAAEYCHFCGQEHELHECTELQTKSPEERNRFVYENRLCFGCMSTGHIVRNCENKKCCNVCRGGHPTALHQNRQRQEQPTITSGHLAPDRCGGAKLQVVTVRANISGRKITTSAFLDTGSTHSFISKRLLHKLGLLPTVKTSVTMSTINSEETLDTCLVPNVLITSMDYSNTMELPPLYVLDKIPVSKEDTPTEEDLEKWPYLVDSGVVLENRMEEVGLLIGGNAAVAMEPLEVIPSQDGGPFAVKTRYGWVLGGERRGNHRVKTNRIKLNVDDDSFCNRAETRRGPSVEDLKWCLKVESSCTIKNGKYEIALPFRHTEPRLPDNRRVAERRLDLLKKKFQKHDKFADEYKQQMDELIVKGHAERVPSSVDDQATNKWYLPHHGVCHPAKPEKLRVVFDCAAKFKEISLNDELLQGPDLTNSLVDVLIRFRQEPIAFMADIEGMFLQVKIPESQRDFLRFLWWHNGDTDGSPHEYRMTVHLFGATSSPSCANYALHRTAEDYGNEYDAEVSKTVKRNFYVDDVLMSTPTEEDAVKLALQLKELCSKGGFHLTKFSSNSVKLLQAVPQQDRARHVKDINLESGSLPVDRALGVHWDVQSDCIGFQVDVEKFTKKPRTKRGILSATAAFYDPLGLAAPYVIRSRMLLQELTRLKIEWDEDVPQHICKEWIRWLQNLTLLSEFSLPRSICPGGLSGATSLELHHFADASQKGYGVVSYIRAFSIEGHVSCGFLLSKAHLAPVKTISIPRLELMAATLAVKTNLEIERALDCKIQSIFFWTDSTTVLKYIRNEKSRFHVFVSNRLAIIHDGSSADQWMWVPSEYNPADLVSRGTEAATLIKSSVWKHGPDFLSQPRESWPTSPEIETVNDEADPEVKATSIVAHSVIDDGSTSPVQTLIEYYSSWARLIRGVAWMRRIVAKLRMKTLKWMPELSVTEVEAAEKLVIQHVQEKCFSREIKDLEAGREVGVSSSIASLDPRLEDGLLRVGGRLRNADLELASKHPLILPSKGVVVQLIIKDIHLKAGHEGRLHTMTDVRRKYWVLKANSAVRHCLRKCLSCRRRLRRTEVQKMADLPQDRIQEGEKAWTCTGVDFFGPFYTKRGRGQTKKYGVIFTCLATRAVHLEVADSLSTDSFLCALRRFIARRGEVRLLRSDNGSNFTGADREMKLELKNLLEHNNEIKRASLKRGIEWKFNPPGASHFGGVWERLIRSVRKILNALLVEQTFSEETLRTLLCEVESIMNNRPLTPVSTDPRDELPLTPNHLLHLKCVMLPVTSVISNRDLYGKKCWRQASYLAEQFWRRWRREYLPLLQERTGPVTRSQVNIKNGDVVLVVDDSVPRGVWPLGLIEEVRTSADTRVRSAKIRCRGLTLWRPVSKLVKIVEVKL